MQMNSIGCQEMPQEMPPMAPRGPLQPGVTQGAVAKSSGPPQAVVPPAAAAPAQTAASKACAQIFLGGDGWRFSSYFNFRYLNDLNASFLLDQISAFCLTNGL